MATKKADVTEYQAAFNHVGSLINEPPAQASCSSSSHPTNFVHHDISTVTDEEVVLIALSGSPRFSSVGPERHDCAVRKRPLSPHSPRPKSRTITCLPGSAL